MPLAIPTTKQLVQRMASAMLAQPFVAADGTIVRLDPNAPGTLEQVLGTVWALAMREIYAWQRDYCLELMVTTATENGLLPQHAQEWSTPRKAATAAIGNVLVTASAAVTLPINTAFVSDGSIQWLVTTATSIAAGATVSVPVKASATGTSGNLAGGTELTLVTPVTGVTSAIVYPQGIAGGAAIEPVEAWRARIIANIRNPDGGGTVADYQKWAQEAGAAYVNVVPTWLGAGTVGIIVAMSGPVAATDAQVQDIQAYIDSVRPVRGNAYVVAAQIVTRNVTIQLDPDTVDARDQITAQLTVYYPGKGIGGRIYREEIDAIISTINGNSNDLLNPTADETLPNNEMAVLGTITWQSSS